MWVDQRRVRPLVVQQPAVCNSCAVMIVSVALTVFQETRQCYDEYHDRAEHVTLSSDASFITNRYEFFQRQSSM